MMLSFNIEQKGLISKFKEYRNSIDIYTEDNDKDKEFYVRLLKQLMQETEIIINDIYPLGCCQEVINHCKTNTQLIRKKLYIIDGDIHLIHKPKETIPNLFVLNSYCIENYVVEKKSVVDFAYEIVATMPKHEVEMAIKYDEHMRKAVDNLINLFLHFSILMEVSGKFQLLHIESFIVGRDISEDLVNSKVEEIKGQILTIINEENYSIRLKDRIDNWERNIDTLLRIVSGKDYLIPYSVHLIKKLKSNFTLDKETIKFMMLKYCTLDRLLDLKTTILTQCS